MVMLHLIGPDPELKSELAKHWPVKLLEFWDIGDIVIKAESVSRWDGCWHFFTMTQYIHLHLIVPVNKCKLIRKVEYHG